MLTGDVASVGAARGACVVATMIGGGGGASDVSPSFGSLPLSAIVSRVSASLFGWLRAIELRFDGPARLIRLFYVRLPLYKTFDFHLIISPLRM